MNLREDKEITVKQSDLVTIMALGFFGYAIKEPGITLLISSSLLFSHMNKEKKDIKQSQP